MSQEPPSLKWVALFMDSMNRALDGVVYSWELKHQADPLSWVLVVTLRVPFSKVTARHFREQLAMWSEVNEAKYQRSSWKNYQLKALLFIRGLGPEQNTNPYTDEVDIVLLRRRRGGLWRARKKRAPPPPEVTGTRAVHRTVDEFLDD